MEVDPTPAVRDKKRFEVKKVGNYMNPSHGVDDISRTTHINNYPLLCIHTHTFIDHHTLCDTNSGMQLPSGHGVRFMT